MAQPGLERLARAQLVPTIGASGACVANTNPNAILVGDHILSGAIEDGTNDLHIVWGDHSEVLFTNFQDDYHASPSFLRRSSDGHILMFACRHFDEQMLVWTTTEPDDPTSWEGPVNIASGLGKFDYTYPNPVELTDESRIYLVVRAEDSTLPSTNPPLPGANVPAIYRRESMHISYSEDDGETWAPLTRLLQGGRPFFSLAVNGTDRLDFLVTDGSQVEIPTNSLYHFYYQAGGYFTTDGVTLGSPPFVTYEDLGTPIWDGGSVLENEGGSVNLADIQIDEDGNPVVAWIVFHENDYFDQRFWAAKWDGSQWLRAEVCRNDSNVIHTDDTSELGRSSSGQLCLDSYAPRTLYAALPHKADVIIPNRNPFNIFKFTTDDFVTWQARGQLTFNALDSIRPRMIEGTRRFSYFRGQFAGDASFPGEMCFSPELE